MDRSLFLSKVIGIYLVIVSLAVFVNVQQFMGYVYSLISDVPLMFVTGFFTLILGILMVVSHSIWEWSWRLIITILAWITLLKGASTIFYPQFVDQMTLLFIQSVTAAYIEAGIDLVLGLILLYFGYRR